jgi:hypothetical protein
MRQAASGAPQLKTFGFLVAAKDEIIATAAAAIIKVYVFFVIIIELP